VIYDISQRLQPSLPVWPGDGAFQCESTAQVSLGSSVTLHRLAMSTQSGTHAESARHVRDDSPALDQLPLEIFLGPCVVLDVTTGTDVVTAVEVLTQLDDVAAQGVIERVLLRTFAKADWQRWPEEFRAIDPILIDALAQRGCRLIGTDAPSIDPATSKTLDAHHGAHRAGMAILEGLVLDRVPPGCYELIALPLPIDQVEATPVRAILRPWPAGLASS
jgi:arylformamidase